MNILCFAVFLAHTTHNAHPVIFFVGGNAARPCDGTEQQELVVCRCAEFAAVCTERQLGCGPEQNRHQCAEALAENAKQELQCIWEAVQRNGKYFDTAGAGLF